MINKTNSGSHSIARTENHRFGTEQPVTASNLFITEVEPLTAVYNFLKGLRFMEQPIRNDKTAICAILPIGGNHVGSVRNNIHLIPKMAVGTLKKRKPGREIISFTYITQLIRNRI